MKKVINITLGNIVFAIEHDAYDALSAYLEAIQVKLSSDDVTEVMGDVESAIAEKFSVRGRSEKLAVTANDVSEVIAEMGSPEAFGDEEPVEKSTAAQTEHGSSKRRLYRDGDNAIIGGVASGLAQYFDIDPVIVRLVFVVSVFFNGLGFLAYLILWLVVPAAKTTTDKYAMRGERITLKDISERVKTSVEDMDFLEKDSARGAWSNLRGFLDKLFRALGVVVKATLKVLQFVVGLGFVIGGALGLAGMVAIYSVILLSEKVLFPHDVQVALDTLQGSLGGVIAMISSFVMMAIPLLVLIIAGASLLAKRNFFTTPKSVTLAVVWIVAAVLAGTTTALQVEQVMQKMGPIEGRFDDRSFEMRWENGALYGNEHEFNFEYLPPPPPERMTITGTFDCIDEHAAINPPSESCIQGLRTAEGELYGLDFMLMSMTPPALEVGNTITVSGPFIPVERMSAAWWHESEVEGVLSATSLEKVE